MSRFDYVRYDESSQGFQNQAKAMVKSIETFLGTIQVGSAESQRAVERAIDKLEECYMWVGKAIRDRQIYLNGPARLQEERSNS